MTPNVAGVTPKSSSTQRIWGEQEYRNLIKVTELESTREESSAICLNVELIATKHALKSNFDNKTTEAFLPTGGNFSHSLLITKTFLITVRLRFCRASPAW